MAGIKVDTKQNKCIVRINQGRISRYDIFSPDREKNAIFAAD